MLVAILRFFGWTNLCREEIGSLNEFIMLYTSPWLIKRALVHARSMWKLYSSFRMIYLVHKALDLSSCGDDLAAGRCCTEFPC